jgi:hypothetical protein
LNKEVTVKSIHVTAGFIAVLIAGCAATQLKQGVNSVKLVNSEPGKECQFVGDVTGNQGDFFRGAFTSNENLETGARNDIKNKAAAMGGNLIVILTQRAGQTGGVNGGGHQTNVTLTGNVYRCPA